MQVVGACPFDPYKLPALSKLLRASCLKLVLLHMGVVLDVAQFQLNFMPGVGRHAHCREDGPPVTQLAPQAI